MTRTDRPKTLCSAFQRTVTLAPDTVALRTVGDSRTVTWREYGDRVRALAAGMSALGIGHGDTVALMMGNRPEFHLTDTAAIHLGAVPFSVYNTSAPDQIRVILANSASRLVITEQQYVARIRAAGGAVEHIVVVDEPVAGTMTLDELAAAGSAATEFEFDAAWQAVGPHDVVSLIYTSGTTGAPKGVELTHANLLAEIDAVLQVFEVRPGDHTISYLPSAHIADRLSCHYLQLTEGIRITTLADAREIGPALRDVRPDYLSSVPRIWEKLKIALDGVIGAAQSLERVAFAEALRLGYQRIAAERDGERLDAADEARRAELDAAVLAPLRQRFGFDNLRWGMSGAAPIPGETLEFFMALGIPVCEIWGMSESVGAATVNPPDRVRPGTVGRVLPGVELRVAPDGEALVRGPIVMRGYRGDPQRTAEVLDAEGWLSTGDIVEIDEHGYVRIVDRKKELIINAAGKNMSPTNIENTIKVACPLVAQAVAIGDGRRYNTALIVLDAEAAATFAAGHGLSGTAVTDLVSHPAVIDFVSSSVAQANTKLSRVEQIKRFRILPDFWEPGSEQLTATMKLKRKPIAARYDAEIEAMYAEGLAPGVREPGRESEPASAEVIR
ncbi:putative fatty-acid--CoA ligase [Nocardia nova SH22a]|uniref:Putative fatty-acid--CoA ligase n=1 Tax=Nocardia nova SH22a TaxID=1415166 RepID=W5THZ9_9NOCA|nr:long-chain fatty acid--CoA ligase [Nocardia nova]AHH18628.1 putative fatty-acid--CoA ligase [Nocardia nova SH22a]